MVPARGIVTVTFRAKLTLSILGIVVEALSPPYPATGGSASILRTDIPGQTALVVNIPNQGGEYYTWSYLVPGTYVVTYTPPSGLKLPDGSADSQSATIGGPNVTWVTFSMTH